MSDVISNTLSLVLRRALMSGVVSEDERAKAKALLKKNQADDSERSRAMRAYWRGVAAGRNVAYLLKQQGDAGKGAKAAAKLLSESGITESVGQTIWTQLRQMKLNGFPLPAYLGAKNPSASADGLTVDLRGKWKGRVIIKLNKATDLYDLTFGRIRKYQWIEDSKVLGVEVGNLAHVLQRYVEYGEAKKGKTKKGKTITAGVEAGSALTEDYTAADLDAWWAESRPKLIKGSKATRLCRMTGCIKSLKALRDGGVVGDGTSQAQLNPVPKKERDSEDQPVDRTPGKVDEDVNTHEAQENDMSLNDAIARFRGLDEANIPAPGVNRATNGTKQISPKSRFSPSYNNGPFRDYSRNEVSVPADAEAMAPAFNSTAGVKGPGYGADGRENVDVRVEDIQLSDLNENQIAQVLGDIAQVSVNAEKFLEMVDHELGLDNLDERLVAAVGNHVFGAGSIQVQTETRDDLHNKGMGIDDFAGGDDESDLSFAEGMINDTLDRRGPKRMEQNLRAPKVGRTNAGGKQISPASKFAREYDPVTGETKRTYLRKPATMPADKEAMAAAERATAGVTGQGYGPDGREEVDVRVEGREYREPEKYDEAFFMSQSYPGAKR